MTDCIFGSRASPRILARPMPEGRTPSALKPAHYFAHRELFRQSIEKQHRRSPLYRAPLYAEEILRSLHSYRTVPEGCLASYLSLRRRCEACSPLMPCGQRGADSAASVAGGWLDPQFFEGPFTKDPSIGHTVQCNSARQAEIFGAGFSMQSSNETKHHLFCDFLDRAREIHITLGQQRLSGFRGGPPNRSSNLPLVIVSPVQ